ncbi:MAG: hypothetical protein GY822_19195 [Deltaproteobacteria bacterium]|nr:hypothetical protein [Deltaproteobacteria bacterium]
MHAFSCNCGLLLTVALAIFSEPSIAQDVSLSSSSSKDDAKEPSEQEPQKAPLKSKDEKASSKQEPKPEPKQAEANLNPAEEKGKQKELMTENAAASGQKKPSKKPKSKPVNAPQCEVVVMNLDPRGLPEEQEYVAEVLTNTLATEISKSSRCKVITEVDIRSMLDFEETRTQCGNESESCMSEIGNALGVDLVVAGVVSKLGEEYSLQAILSNLAKGQVVGRYDATVIGSPSLLKNAAKNAGRVLFDLDAKYGIRSEEIPEEEAPQESVSSMNMGIWLMGGGAALSVVGVGLAVGMEVALRTERDGLHHGYQAVGLVSLAGAAVGVATLGVGAGFGVVGVFE